MAYGDRKPARAVPALLALGLHLALASALVAAFRPTLVPEALQPAGLVALDLDEPRPPPPPPPPPRASSRPAGASGKAGKRAVADAVVAPSPAVDIPRLNSAPPVVSTGTAQTSGAVQAGAGTGGGGAGLGTGSGGSGNGMGGGGKAVQISGDINNARDYPGETRDQRIGTFVVIVFTVGTDGRVHDCRVRDPGGDPASDAITCRLATERFRFRPATDRAGNPVPSLYGWKQSWHY